MMDVQDTGEALSSQTKHSALQNLKFLHFSLNLDPDPHWERGSGSSRPKSKQIWLHNTLVVLVLVLKTQ
jgi:hypothetical protein